MPTADKSSKSATRRPRQLLGCDLSDNASIARNAHALGLSEEGFISHSRQKRNAISDPERLFVLSDEDARDDDQFAGMQIIDV